MEKNLSKFYLYIIFLFKLTLDSKLLTNNNNQYLTKSFKVPESQGMDIINYN